MSLAADVNAVLAVNRGEAGQTTNREAAQTTQVDAVSHVRVVQRSRRPGPQPPDADATENEQEDPNDR